MKDTTPLVGVRPDGTITAVPNTYEGIKAGLDDGFLEMVQGEHFGAYIDEEGLLKGLEFNFPASILLVRAVFGPVVLCDNAPDDEGDTVPMPERFQGLVAGITTRWRAVLAEATHNGQSLTVLSTSDTIPAPTIIAWGPDGPEVI